MQATFPGAACCSVDKSHLCAASSAAIRLLRDVARKLSYRTGALSLYHRVRNRQVPDGCDVSPRPEASRCTGAPRYCEGAAASYFSYQYLSELVGD